MRQVIRYNSVNYFLIAVVIIITVIDPTGKMTGLKEISFIAAMLSTVIYGVVFKNMNFRYQNLLIVFLLVIFPVMSLISAPLLGNEIDFFIWLGFFKSYLYVFFLFVLINSERSVLRIFIIATLSVALLSIISYISITYKPELYISIYDFFVRKTDNAIFSFNRSFLGYNVHSMFYKTSPLLIITLAYLLFRKSQKKKRDFLLSIIVFLGLLFTGTRASMLGAFSLVLLFFLKFIYINISKKIIFIPIVIVLAVLFYATINLLSDKQEYSNKIKYANLESYIYQYSNPKTIVFGQGVGSSFYVTGRQTTVTHTELSYMDIFRMYGFFFGSLFLFIIFIPGFLMLLKGASNAKAFGIGYLVYLPVAGTNPLLISSTGFLVVSIAYWYLYNLKK